MIPTRFIFALAALQVPAAMYAQVSAASINGTARDSTGAVVPGASILLRNSDTAVETRTATDDQGV